MEFFRIARITRPHGAPRPDQILKWKADLFHSGGAFLEGRSEIWIQKANTEDTPVLLKLAEISPMGGKWGEANGIMFAPAEFLALIERDAHVCVPREWLPELDDDEFYVEDIMNFEVVDEDGKVWGRVIGCDDPSGESGASVNILVKGPRGEFSFPAAWLETIDDEGERIEVPGVKEWAVL